jgi:hypothetical protein
MNENTRNGRDGYTHRSSPEKYGGLSDEIYQTIARYFAPMVALYAGIESAFQMKPWQRRQVEKDSQPKHPD